MKLLPLLAAFLFATTTSRAPEPTTLQQLVEKAFTPPAPDATAPGRFLLHTSGGTLYRLDTATGGTWEMAAQLAPNGGTVNAATPEATHKAVTGFFKLEAAAKAKAPAPLCA
jgi:hypothetical protein